MKYRTFKKQSQPLHVTFGVKPHIAATVLGGPDRTTTVDAGWIKLHIGWDQKGNEVLYATTPKHNVLMCAWPPLTVVPARTKKRLDWVFAIEQLPADFLNIRVAPTTISYGGYCVKFGVDHQGRDFLYVAMPGANLSWLIRNPESGTTAAWSQHLAVAVNQGMVIRPAWTPAVVALAKKDVTKEPDDLDLLLAALG